MKQFKGHSHFDRSGSGLSRRSLLAACAGAAATMVSTTGCIISGDGSEPEIVWGRRGFSEGRFQKPRAIAIDESDQLYICDTTGRIQVFDADGQQQRFWKTPATKNGRPTGMTVRPADQHIDQPLLLVADTHYYRMLAYTLQGELLDDASIGGTAGIGEGEFAFVTDAICDDEGCFYISEYNESDRIQKFDPSGEFMTQWGETGRKPEQFLRPQGLAIHNKILYIADACNHRIQRYDISAAEPKLIDIWGGEGKGIGKFYYPYGIDFASDGSLLIVEYGNQRIQRFSPQGKPIASWGTPGFDAGQLYQPWGVVVDSKDRVHILDSNNHRVQRVSLPS